jgi:RNA-directed DNA polymerase
MSRFIESTGEIPNLHRAFARVEASRGMAGMDGVSIAGFKHNLEVNLARLAVELQEIRYEPLPLLRRWVWRGITN